MSDGFAPTSTPPRNPILAKTRTKAATQTVEPENEFTPFDRPVFDVPPPAAFEDIGAPPVDLMAPTDTSEGLYTDATYDEIDAGRRASEAFAKRRKAELEYGKNYAVRRKAAVK